MGEVKTGRKRGRATVAELGGDAACWNEDSKAEKGRVMAERMMRNERGVK